MSRKNVNTPLIYALEPRLLFDGDLGTDVASAIVYRDGNSDGESAPAVAPESQRENVRTDSSNKRYAVVIIDSAVDDYETLVNAAPEGAEVHFIDGEEDGFDQISALLENHENIDELHIFGHGLAGEARLGTASLSLPTLTTHSDALAVLKNALSEEGDILLYGCNIAQGDKGQAFIEELAEITAADIAASDDITGAGGDWALEVTTGSIETETIIASEYLGRLTNGVASTTSVTEVHSATDLQSGSGQAGSGVGDGIQITQEETAIQTGEELNFNLGSNLTNNADLQLDSYLVYFNQTSGTSGAARIIFDNGIAGINWVDWRSDDSGVLDAQFAKDDASYDDPQGRGLESGDRQNVSFSGRVLNITGDGLTGDTNGDYMRVFVYSSPAAITAVNDAVTATESVAVETGAYQAAANINLTNNDTTTSNSKRVVGLGTAQDNITDNPSHDNIQTLDQLTFAGTYGELRVDENNGSISYWVTNDGDLEDAIAAANGAVTETFYYRVANEFGSESEGQLTITINEANDRPVAGPYTITRTYDGDGFTVGTSSADHPLATGRITDADDDTSFVFSGIHEETNSNITLSDAVQEITFDNFGTVTVNESDELVFMPHEDLANLPQGQSISRSFIYFVSDDGGAYNEGSDGVDRTDIITISIDGTAAIEVPQFKDENAQVAKFYFQKNNTSTSDGNASLTSQRLNVLNDTRFTYSSDPTEHAQSNLQNGNLIDDIWTVSGNGNTLEFGGWVFADGSPDTGNAYASEKQGVTSNAPRFAENSGAFSVQNSNYFNFDETLAEDDTGTFTWYYRVNVVNGGNVVSSEIGQLDIILEGINDTATARSNDDQPMYDKANSGQGERITTDVTASKDLDASVADPDAGDTVEVQRIRLSFDSGNGEANAALAALDGDMFYLNRGQSTDDSGWESSDAWGTLSDHFTFTFNSDGSLNWVSKRDDWRSEDGRFLVSATAWTEISGRDGVANIDRTGSISLSNFYYSANTVEFVDDAVAVNSSADGSGSVDSNDNFFASLESFQRSTGSQNLRVAAGETIIGEYITLTMNADGSYSYTVNQTAFDALGDGETASESFTYWGDHNASAGNDIGQATLTFNLTGVADNFVAVDDTARVVAGGEINGGSGDRGNQSLVSVYETSGTLISNDINDVGNLTIVSFRTGREADSVGTTDIPLTGSGWTTVSNGQIRWYNNRYEFQASSSVNSEVTEYFTYTVRNGEGEEDTAELAITILPASDNEFVVEDYSHSMTDISTEAGLTKTETIANLLTHDSSAILSGNETGASYAVTGYVAGNTGSGFSNVGTEIRGTYGTLTISADGVPTYVFDRPYSLNTSEVGYDIFTFEVTDGRDTATTNTAQLTVRINGRDTTPSWSSDATIAIAEDTGVTLSKYGDVAAQGDYITRTLNGDGGYDYTYDADAFNALGDDERSYNTALTGGWANYLEDELGDVGGYNLATFDNVSVNQSSFNTAEGWTSWQMQSGSFPADKIGAATNQNTILIGAVPFGNDNTQDQIDIDNTVPVGESRIFEVGDSEVSGSLDIRGTFDVTVLGVQNTPVVSVADDSASEPALFRFGNFYEGSGSFAGDYPDNTLDLFSNDTTSDYSNIARIEISANGTSGWTAISKNSEGNAQNGEDSRIISGSDFYWRGGKYYNDENWIEFSPGNFEALGPDDQAVSGVFYYRLVELDGTESAAARVSATLTPVDDAPGVYRQAAILNSSGTVSIGANEEPIANRSNDANDTAVANPPSGVSTRYVIGNNETGNSIINVNKPGEHTGGLLDQSYSTNSADPENNSVILSVTQRYISDAATSELRGLGNNSDTSVTLRGNHGELTVNEDGSYTYTADMKRALNWQFQANSFENYDYADSFNIRLGPTGAGGAGSVTTTLDVFFDGTDTAPTAGDDTAHVREDLNIAVSGNAAEFTTGGDDDSAVDAPGEHSGNLLANDTDVNENANLQISRAGVNGGSFSTLNLATDTDNPYRQITGTYGSLSIYQDGSYNYVANQDAADNLAAGETADDVFQYRVVDNQGDTDDATLTITVHGTANESYDREVTTAENQTYDFVHTIVDSEITATDFWTSDEVDSNYNPPIEITSLPHSGTLRLGETDVVLENGRFRVNAEDMDNLNYVPPENINGDDYTFFTYEILVDGQDMSDVSVTMTIDITPDSVNNAPTVQTAAVDPSIAEIADASAQVLNESGTIIFADDTDTNLAITGAASATVTLGENVTLSAELQTTLEAAISITDNNDNTASWALTTAGLDLDFLNAGQTITLDYVVTATDAEGLSVTDTVTATITGTNDVPETSDNTVTTQEETRFNFTASDFGFSDVDDGEEFTTIEIITLPTNGSLILEVRDENGNYNIYDALVGNAFEVIEPSKLDDDSQRLHFTPDDNENGNAYASFLFKVSDGNDNSWSDNATMTIDVTPEANIEPVAEDDVFSVVVGTPATGNVINPDTNADGEAGEDSDADDDDSITVNRFSRPNSAAVSAGERVPGTYGSLTLSENGSYTYTVDAENEDVVSWGVGDDALVETFTYEISDGSGGSDTATITVNISGVNDAPTADPINQTRVKTANDLRIDLLVDANATDVDDSDTLTVINDGDSSDDEPSVSFTRTGTTRLVVGVENSAYTLNDQREASFTLNSGRTYVFDWSEQPSHPLRFSETQNGTHSDGAEYTTGVSVDVDAGTTTIVVADGMPTLYVYCENHSNMGFDTPVADYALPENAYRIDRGILTVSPQAFADLASDNRVEIEVSYNIADGDVSLDTTDTIQNTATVTITGLNTQPQIIDNYNDRDANNDAPNVADVTTAEDTAYTFTLDDFNYVDQDNDPLSNVLIVQLPRDGQLTLNGEPVQGSQRITRADIENGLLDYTPPENENGESYTSFTYAVNDGQVDSEVGAMTIHVTPVNDAPESDDKFVRILGKRTVQFSEAEFTFRDKDVGDTLNHITLRSLPASGVLYLIPADIRLPSIIDPPMLESWAISEINSTTGLDISKAELSRLIYVANEAVKTREFDAFTFTVNDGSQITPGPLDSVRHNKITLGKVIFAEPIIEPEPKEPAKKERVKLREKPVELNLHDLTPVMKVAIDEAQNRQISNAVDWASMGGRDLLPSADDDAGLGDDNWMNTKASSDQDISGNIRVIDLKIEGRAIAVQITDEASDRAERFKGELADGSPLPDWVKVDRNTGLTTAEPPAGAKPFEMRVVAEDGGGNSRAIDLVLDPTALNGQESDGAPSPVANRPNAEVILRAPQPATQAAPTRVTANVLADGQVAISDAFAADATGSLKLMRMVSETDGIKVEINDDARADQTRYEVRQKDGSAAPDWVQVNARTGELTIDAPENIGTVELTLVALDGGAQRTMDLELALDELRAQDADGEDGLDNAEGVPDEDLDSGETDISPVGRFTPLGEQIDAALSESSYGRDIQKAMSAAEV